MLERRVRHNRSDGGRSQDPNLYGIERTGQSQARFFNLPYPWLNSARMTLHQLLLAIIELRREARAEKNVEQRKIVEEVIREYQRQILEEVDRFR